MDIKNSGLDLVNYGIWYEPFWKTKGFYLLVLIVLCFIFALVLILLFKKFKNKKQLSSIDRFYYKIDLLSKNKTNNVEKFYIELILILKEYLSLSLNYDLFANTDDELISSLTHLNFPSDLISKLSPILSRAQMAKFANCVIDKDQILQDLGEAKLAVCLFESSKPNVDS